MVVLNYLLKFVIQNKVHKQIFIGISFLNETNIDLQFVLEM